MKLAGPRAGLPQVPAAERVVGEIGKAPGHKHLLAMATSFELCQRLCLLPVEGARGQQGAQHSFLFLLQPAGFYTPLSRNLLRVPWTARRSNQSILKEINPEYSLEGLMLKLKLQYFGHLM